MAYGGKGNVGGIRLSDLVALNDEMAALVRAGVPLDRGLLALGTDMHGRPGQVASRLSERLSQGQSLNDALEAEGNAIPSFYRAVVHAGIRSGHLPSALEGLSRHARQYEETRKLIGLALVYPVMVFMLSYIFFLLLVLLVAPRIASMFEAFHFTPRPFLNLLVWLGDHFIVWAPIVPALLLLFFVGWWVSGRASRLRPGRVWGVFRFIPGMSSILQETQAGDFAGLLALMVENGVPLEEAIPLSAEATGSRKLHATALELSQGLRRGEPLSDLAKHTGGMSSMLVWVLTSAGSAGSLVPGLKHTSETYRYQALRRAETIRGIVPSLTLCVIGAGTAAIYVLAVIYPMLVLWKDLAIPVNE